MKSKKSWKGSEKLLTFFGGGLCFSSKYQQQDGSQVLLQEKKIFLVKEIKAESEEWNIV